MLLKASDSLHHCTLKVGADTHNLSSSLHLSCKSSLGCDELIEWKPWELNYAVVKGWLKACVGLTCNSVLDLIKCVSKSNLGCNLGNRVTCCLTCKS